MKHLMFIIIFFSLQVLASGQDQSAPVIDTTRPVPALRTPAAPVVANPSTTNLQNIRRGNGALVPAELQQLLQRANRLLRTGGGGGDDVGNGGDELRSEFLRIAEGMLTKVENSVLKQQLASIVTINRVITVEALAIHSGSENIPVRATVAEGLIILDAAAWNPQTGLLSQAFDPRYEMLRLINMAAGSPARDAELVVIWNKLEPISGRIWCPHYPSRIGESRRRREFEAKGLNAELAEQMAMTACQSNNLVDCRRSRVFTGSGGLYEVTVSGFAVSMANKTRAQMAAEACQAIHSCESVYEWAPRGQVSPSDFSALAGEAERTCRR